MSLQKSFIKKQCAVDLTLVFLFYVFTTAVLILYFRRGDWSVLQQVLTMAVYPILLFGLTTAGWQSLSSANALWVLPLATVMFASSPFLLKGIGLWSLFLLAALGVGLTLLALYSRQPQMKMNLKRLLFCLIAGMAIALIFFVQVNGAGYAHIFADVAMYTNSSHPDTLFHSSIVNMLAGFSTPSIGLDGVQHLDYHVGVHRWLAASQTLLNAKAPLLLAVSMQVAILPALFFTWIFALTTLGKKVVDPLITLVIGMISLGVLGAFTWDSYLLSESYAFSLIILLPMVPIGRLWLERSCERRKWLSIPPWQLCFATIVVTLCSLAKVSTGCILAIFLISCVTVPQLFQKNRRALFKYAAGGAIALFACLSLVYVYIGSPDLELFPLHFPRSFPTEFFNEVIFASFFLGAFYVLGQQERDDESHCRYCWASFLALTVTFIAGLLPGLTLSLPAGAAYYFSHPALLVVLMWGISTLIDSYALIRPQEILIRFHPRQLRWQLVSKRLWWAVITLLGFTVFVNWPLPPLISQPITRYKVFLSNAASARALFSDGVPFKVANARPKRWQQRFTKLVLFPVIDLTQLRDLSGLGYVDQAIEEEGLSAWDPSIAVYIDPEFDRFWSVDGSQFCWAKPFEVPAMVGLPLINGVRGAGNNCDSTPYYGLGDYDSTSWNLTISDTQLCQKARSLGLAKVLMITENGHQVLNCAD